MFAKGEIGDNGIYNQDLSDKALLLEFGGVDNNMEELKNASNAAADVFSEIFWDAEKVDGKAKDEKNGLKVVEDMGSFIGKPLFYRSYCYSVSFRNAASQ